MKLVTSTNTLCARLGIKEAIRIIKECGFDGYDCGIQRIVSQSNPKDREYYLELAHEIREYSDSLGIPCLQTHSVSASLNRPEVYDQCFAFESLSVEMSAILGADVCVVHPAFYMDVEQNYDQFYSKLTPIAKKGGFLVATENMFKGGHSPEGQYQYFPSVCGTCEDFVHAIDYAKDPNYTACLDIGHASLINHEGAPALIHALGRDRLKALHVHDNDVIHDTHLFPYFGKINWNDVCRALAEIDYTGHFTFEADGGYLNLPNELLADGCKLLERIGRQLIEKVAYYKANPEL